MSEKPISPLRQRMIDDMTARRFKERVQKDYVRHVRAFAAFLGRSPDTTGGGEVVHYIGKYGAARVDKAVLVSSVPPLMLKTPSNPEGTSIEVFDNIRKNVAENRSQFYRDLTLPFFGYNRPGAKVSEGVREHFWLQGMLGSIKGHYDCVHEFS